MEQKPCDCVNADHSLCSQCAQYYCSVCWQYNMKKAFEEIMNNDSCCLECSYNRSRKPPDNTSSDRLQSASSKVQENKQGILEEPNIPELDNRVFQNISEDIRQIILTQFLKKTDQLLKLSTATFENICSFKNKINKTFSVDDIKDAYDYLLKIICTNIKNCNHWQKELEDMLKEVNSNSNENKTPEKKKISLSLKKSENLTTLAESVKENSSISLNIEHVIDNSKIEENESKQSVENSDILEDNSKHSAENLNIIEDNSKHSAENLNIIEDNSKHSVEVLDIIEDNSNDSIFSQATVRNLYDGVTEEKATFSIDNDHFTENSRNESENSFVFTVSRPDDTLDNFEENSRLELPNINVDDTIKEELPFNMSKDSNCTDFLGLERTQKGYEEIDEAEREMDMLRILENIEDKSFTMSEYDSLSDGSEDQELNEYIQLPEGIYGIITNTLPSLPSTNNDMLVDTDEDKFDNNIAIKPCSVVLERIDGIMPIKKKSSSKEEDEIERLINLKNLDNKRKHSFHEGTSNTKVKRTRTESSSDVSQLESDGDDSSGILESLLENDFSSENRDMREADVLESLLNKICCDEDDNEEDDNAEELTDLADIENPTSTDENVTKSCSNKENEPVKNSTTVKELPKKDNNSKWRLDPLLNCSLNEITEKPGPSTDACNSKIKRKNNLNTIEKEKEESTMEPIEIKSNHESDDEDDDEDVEAKYNKIIVNSDSDSDIEFVSVERNVKKKLKDSTDSEGKRGRRNIREILDDTTLTEATKEANLLERKRKSRLNKKQKNMDAILSQSQFSEDDDGLILDFDEDTKTPNVVVHPRLTNKLKPHQRSGVKFMWESCYEGIKQINDGYQGSGCILAHCMGLGKTLQVITLIHTLFKHNVAKIKHVLIVSPLSVVLHWEREFQEAMRQTNDNLFRVFSISTGKVKSNTVNLWQKHNGVLVMGYECFNRLVFHKNPVTFQEYNIQQALLDPGPDLIVLDEGHLIKNENTLRSKSFRNLKTKRRICLTGTPLQNNLNEYYCMIQFVKPNLLGSLPEYKNRFANPITNGQYYDSTEVDIIKMKKRSHVLNKILKGTVQRYELSELVPYLKKRHDYALFIQLHPLQMDLYEKQAGLACSNLQDGINAGPQVLSNYHKFQLIWAHPYMFNLREKAAQEQRTNKEDCSSNPDFWWKGHCPSDSDVNINYGPKFKVMLSIIKECERMGDKILVFSNSIFELNAIEHFLHQYSNSESRWIPNEDYLRMDGSTPSEARIHLCDSFNNKNNRRKRLFLISNKVGGMGINLIGANRVILMDVNWNPAIDSQSVFRIYRFGQGKECFVYRLISMGTMEEVVYERQVTKLAIAGRVIDSLQITRHFNSNDLQIFYRPKFNRGAVRPTPILPADCLLAKVLQSCSEIFRYHEHQSLLENLPDENLNEDDMQLAWEEFNKESDQETMLQMKMEKKKKPAGPSSAENLSNNQTNPLPSNSKFKSPVNTQFNLPLLKRPVVARTAQNVIRTIQKNGANEAARTEYCNNNNLTNNSKVVKTASSNMNLPIAEQRLKKTNESNDIPNLQNKVNLNRNDLIANSTIQSIQRNSRNKLPHRTKNPVVNNLPAIDTNDTNVPIIYVDFTTGNIANNKSSKQVEASSSNTINLEKTELNKPDIIINLDDINVNNLLRNEQQSLISSLNQNLDITLSTLAVERNQNQKIENVIEID